MLSRLSSATLRGIEAEPVTIEVDLSRGLPAWVMVGLADTSVKESRERIRSALTNAGFEFPLRHITINLSPADRRKEGSHFDLPVAIGVLLSSGQIESTSPLPFMAAELGLDGSLRPTRGVLSLAIFAKSQGFSQMIVAPENAVEAAMVEGLDVFSATSLLDVVAHLSAKTVLLPFDGSSLSVELLESSKRLLRDLVDVRGQHHARRAIEIAAAGQHHLLMVGAPGVGKSMLAERVPSILPPLTSEQQLEVARIYSAVGDQSSRPVMSRVPPYRSPHHTASDVAMIGGGSIPKPGEVSRAHRGVLFLDELPEFRRTVLEVLRQPLESGEVCVSRAADSLAFPARFQLIAAMNPCPCGYLGHVSVTCKCSPTQVQRYQSRLSGPLLDRFDLRIHVPVVDREELLRQGEGESSAVVAARVATARTRQYARQGVANAELQVKQLQAVASLGADAQRLVDRAMTRFNLSARSYHRMLKVARTIADLQGCEDIGVSQISEALQFREEI
ncbi:MAG: YifB family Mg chelatase-like AAA ATPase [Zetaproteobacteria bacterium]|nr:YifB family Mg chelatase-like AAA ATPase [Zetaproteobacteria bacterium]